MTDTDLTAPVQRLNYFDQQFLRESDFSAEQSYHLQMRRLHNRIFHTWGIAEGYDLSFEPGATHVTVAPGIAIDRLGREIVLTRDVGTDDLAEYRDQTVYLSIAYNEQQSNPTSETGVTGYTRWTERPTLRISSTAPAGDAAGIQLLLGLITLNAAGTIETVEQRRRVAGSRAGDLEALSATVAGDVTVGQALMVEGATRLRGPLSVAAGEDTILGGGLNVEGSAIIDNALNVSGSARLAGGLSVTGDVSVSGNVDGRDLASDGNRLDQHLASRANPHGITAEQIGALPQSGGQINGALRVGLNAEQNVELQVRRRAATGGQESSALFRFNSNSLHFSSRSTDQVFLLNDNGSTVLGGDVQVRGQLSSTRKQFRIRHPQKAGRDLVHACLEGPENGVYYRGTARLQAGQSIIQLPAYFEALTSPTDRTVHLTAIGPEPFMLSYTPVEAGRFTVYGSRPDGTFAWQVNAVRADVPPLEVEVETEE